MIKDILDFEGKIIGTLELPDDTDDSEWERRLNYFKSITGKPNNVPSYVTRRQMLLALNQKFKVKKQDVLNFIGTLPEPLQYKSLIWFDESQVFERNNELLLQMSPMMGIPTSQLDDLFILAASL